MINNGIWPTMLTPFTEEKKIDYRATEKLIEWYIDEGVDGIFAVCQSSEMEMLTLEERVELAKFVVEKVNGRVSVVASGHVSPSFEEQVEELTLISKTGIDAIILITNRLAKENEDEEVVKNTILKLVEKLPKEIEIGFYECPMPYKRVLSANMIKWLGKNKRFTFVKETSCDINLIEKKIEASKGTNIKIFNANAATLLDSLRLGAAGYNGIMANFHPKLYRKLYDLEVNSSKGTEELMDVLSLLSVIEYQNYPKNAKYVLNLNGIDMSTTTRREASELKSSQKLELKALNRVAKSYI